ncbi:DUF4920 domain-containing protein [Aquimarina aquimarini]|uniref:DUF4920 domain-containing protein n=1 Tax=Aquimarina aquimarini TaxID=1191734 RepID=UPI000D54F53F|nr:DUF4920 domain-containing protein [Aquimarina aquimarini]
MKNNILFLIAVLVLISCNSVQKKDTFSTSDISIEDYKSFGEKVVSDKIYDTSTITDTYDGLKEGDSIDVSFTGTVNSVCKVKGCWMRVALNNDQETMVKFRDYGFFVPKDIENDTVIVQGKAFVSEMSVEDQKHFASDAGKTEKEIASITKPKRTYSFVAEGVLIKE